MQSYYTWIALDLAAERVREADRRRMAALASPRAPGRSLRHGAAVALGSISRATGAIASLLDDRSDETLPASTNGYAASN
jgi:hypothetical protein